MIERAAGHSLVHELKRRIVRPLDLRHTTFPVRKSRLGHGAARGYSLDVGPDGPLPGTLHDVTRYSPSFAWASGNGVSTIGDVARFYRALLRGRLLSPALLHQALSTVSTGSPRRRYGLGLDVYRTPDGTLIGHDGDMPGFSIKARSSRDARLQAIIATNAKYGPPSVHDALERAMNAELALGRRTADHARSARGRPQRGSMPLRRACRRHRAHDPAGQGDRDDQGVLRHQHVA